MNMGQVPFRHAIVLTTIKFMWNLNSHFCRHHFIKHFTEHTLFHMHIIHRISGHIDLYRLYKYQKESYTLVDAIM